MSSRICSRVGAICVVALSSGCVPALLAGAGGLGVSAVREERSVSAQAEDFDTEITIESRLSAQEAARLGGIDIEVFEGRALLTGHAPDEASLRQAVEIAGSAEGVEEVINEVQVAPESSLSGSAQDLWIASRIRAAFVADTKVAGVNYEIAVENGVVHILGLARSRAELDRVARHAAAVPGVQRVVSHILTIDDPRRAAA